MQTQKHSPLLRYGFLLLCCAVLIFGAVTLLNQKEGFFLDEYSSYGCANSLNGKNIRYERGVPYTPEEIQQLVTAHYGVAEGERFRFDNVWTNMADNVHPPLFYALLHLICSLTPGVFSLWQAGILNLCFGLLSLVFFQKIARSLVRSEILAGLLCLAWAATIGLFSTVVLFRDYAAAMCFDVILAWEMLRYLRGRRALPDLLKIAFSSALAVLSHYYCALYLFFLCAVLCIILMTRREWKAVAGIFAAEAVAAGIAIAIFPAMLTQMFSSSRGSEATENLSGGTFSEFTDQLQNFASKTSSAFFGNLLPWLLLLALLLALALLLLRRRKNLPAPSEDSPVSVTPAEIFLLLLPPLCYYLLVSKITSLTSPRFMYLVAPVFYLGVMALLAFLGGKLAGRRALCIGLTVVAAACCAFSWQADKVRYLYQGMNRNIQKKLEPIQGLDAVMLWDRAWGMSSVTLPQQQYYSTVTFYQKCKDEQLENLSFFAEGKAGMLLVMDRAARIDYVERLRELYPHYQFRSLGDLDGQNRFENYYCYPAEWD